MYTPDSFAGITALSERVQRTRAAVGAPPSA